MPANLTPEYLKAEQEYKAAKTPDEKLVCLQRMLSVMPKHKGTDRLQGGIKARIARLREVIDTRRRKKGPSFRVKPEGAGQLMLVGPPNGGKSALLAALTHAAPEIADYPCTTREPIPGMVRYRDVQFQLVDLPPVWREHCEPFVFDNVRASDGVVVVVDLASPDPVRDVRQTIEILGERHMELIPPRPKEESPDLRPGILQTIVVLNKSDLDPDGGLASLVRDMLPAPLPLYPASARAQTGLDAVTAAMFDMLHVVRIYTKEHGQPPDTNVPYTVPVGSTVLDFAGHVHKDFGEQLKAARVWGSAKFDGQIAQRDHVLQDGDIVELTM